VVDELNYLFEYDDRVSLPNIYRKEPRPVPAGYVTDKYLVLANAGARFDPDAEGLKEELLSLLVERIVSGSITNTHPIGDFVNITLDAVTARGLDLNATLSGMYLPYIDGLKTFKTWYLLSDGPDATPWLASGQLKAGRLGYMGFEDRALYGYRTITYSYDKCTHAKDFGDFTAFILTKTAEEREAFYAAVAENDVLRIASENDITNQQEWVVERDGQYYDKRYPIYGGPIGANAIRDKVEFVKKWWEQAGYPLQEPE
jgi:hypothetical protein